MTKKLWQVWEEIYKDGKLKYFNVKFEGTQAQCHKFAGHEESLHVGYDCANTYFDNPAVAWEFTGNLPEQVIKDCSASGDVSKHVKYWTLELEFMLPSLKLGVDYLKEFGTWEEEDLKKMDMFELSQKVLWLACCDIKEQGEWFGLTH